METEVCILLVSLWPGKITGSDKLRCCFFRHDQRISIFMLFSQAKLCESGKGFYESGESGNPEGVAPMAPPKFISLI